MKFTEIDAKMRVFETAHDYEVLPGINMVARMDGRSFTRLTREIHKFDAPFDARLRDMMIATTGHLMQCGFRVIYAHTHSDEISLLFHPEEKTFGRKTRKYNSILAGEASAKFSLLLGDLAAFDCRICELPNAELVRDYFRWRQEDAHRNALNAHCYWSLRKAGSTAEGAANALLRLSVAAKNEVLFRKGINFNDVPAWQKRGTGLYWETYQKEAWNPRTGQRACAERHRIKIDMELPMKEDYGGFVLSLLSSRA